MGFFCSFAGNRPKAITGAKRLLGGKLAAASLLGSDDFGIGSALVFAGASIIALPFALAGLVLALPALIPVGIMASLDSYREYQQTKKYVKNKASCMAEWTKKQIEGLFTPENINALVFESYFKYFENQIHEICDKKIPSKIASDELQIQIIRSDNRTATEILQDFQPLQRSLDNAFGLLRIFLMRHLDNDYNLISFDSLTMDREIAVGTHFAVCRVAFHPHGVAETKYTSKTTMRSNVESKLINSLNEVECLRYVFNIKRTRNIKDVCFHLPKLVTSGLYREPWLHLTF